MAKSKKKAALSLEDRLEQALVPEAEQPYPVPENWCWVRFETTTQPINGFAFKSQNYVESGIRIIRISNVQDGFIEDDKPVFYSNKNLKELQNYLLYKGDLLLSLTGNVGRVAVLDEGMLPAALNQRVACLRINDEQLLDKTYLFLYLLRKEFLSDCIKSSKGSAQLNMSTEWLKKYAIPIPPFSEQQRIVDRIESLFAKLDEAKEKAQAALDSFETRKAAILHKAFTGELTAKWREENGVGMDSWFQDALSSLCKSLKYGTSKKSKEQGKVVVIRMGNLQQGEIDWSNLAYSDDEDDIKKYSLSSGDVLFNRTNSPELVGKTSIYRGNYPAIYAGYLIKLEYGKRLIGEYLNYIMNSSYAKAYYSTVKTDGVNQSNINAKKIGEFVIPVPSIPEQTEIVRLLENFFAKEQKAEELCSVLDKIDLVKKSILARAFRGELGTNDPTEESALDLLKSIV